MSLSATYDFFLGILLLVLAGFIAVPAWTRWTRNLALVRRGKKVTGHYQGRFRVAFYLPDGAKVLFSTWRFSVWRRNLGDELPVLYDPNDPSRAEVMNADALWGQPLGSLTTALAVVCQAVLLMRGTNLGVAYLVYLLLAFSLLPIARLALYLCYPASRLHQFRRASAQSEPVPLFTPGAQQPAPPPLGPAQVMAARIKPVPKPRGPRPPHPQMPRGQAARAQLLRDMIDIPDDLG